MSFICGAGSTNVDLIFSNMQKLPELGKEEFAKDFSINLGGGIPAMLINLSRLGIKTKIATQLGDDMFSKFAESEFKKANAEICNLNNGNEIPLTVTSAVILPQDRTFFSYSGYKEPDGKMKEAFYDLAKGSKITLMEIGGYLEVYKKLKKEGTILVLDTGWDDNMSLDMYGEYLELADYYTPNRIEAMKITNKSTPESAAEELKNYFDKVVVKLDKEGCLGIDGDKSFIVNSIEKFKNVDSTGAGDAFLAGFCYGLYYDRPLYDCILYGNITGGKCVTKIGALTAYVTEDELLKIAKEALS